MLYGMMEAHLSIIPPYNLNHTLDYRDHVRPIVGWLHLCDRALDPEP